MRHQYLDNLTQNLKERFDDSETVSAFSLFNPANLPNQEDILTYGNAEINILAKFDGHSSGSPLFVCSDSLKTEWPLFKFLMNNKYKNVPFKEMCRMVLTDKSVTDSYPNVCLLLKVCLILPVSSADCERGFSRYNLIKTKPRNRLDPATVNTLMMLTADTPSLQNMDQVEFSKAFDIWTKKEARRMGKFFK